MYECEHCSGGLCLQQVQEKISESTEMPEAQTQPTAETPLNTAAWTIVSALSFINHQEIFRYSVSQYYLKNTESLLWSCFPLK